MKLSGKKSLVICLILFLIAESSFADSKYVVKKGDTLYSISKAYKITLNQLREANNLSENDVIKVGQTLKIPDGNSKSTVTTSTTSRSTKDYVVVKGDTLFGIAKSHNMTLNEILNLNNMTSNSVIKVGQKLKVYSGGSTSTTTTTTTTKTTTSSKTTTTTTTNVPDTRTYGNSVTADSTTIWPVKNPTVTTVKGKVNGVQLSAKKDEAVTCVREGSVMYIGVYRGYGQIIFVQSKTGLIYAYAGINNIKVKKGDYVLFGQQLGTAGLDSLTGKSQLTFMVFQNGQSIDPAKAPRN